MPWVWLVVGLVALQRAIELVHASRNTRALLARGGVEAGASHYWLFPVLHGAWLASLLLFAPRDTVPNWWLLGVYALLQLARVWIVATLGPYWTTRIVNVPNAPLVRSGPYRWLRHPNYVVVCAEFAVLPLAFGALAIAIVFSILNAALLSYRIRIEETALHARRTLP